MPGVAGIYEMGAWPFTTATALLCSLIYFYTWNYSVDLGTIAYSYQTVVLEKQYWRIITASYAHANILHLVFNMTSLWSLGIIEYQLGTIQYAKYTLLLVILSMVVVSVLSHVIIVYWRKEEQKAQQAVGYSCVVFGWMAIISVPDPFARFSYLGLFSIPRILWPFASLLLTQVIVPRASFIGHLSGILVGYVIGAGLFAWITNYLFWCLLFWVVIIFLWSLKTRSTFDIPCLKFNLHLPASPAYTLVNGVIVREGRARRSDFETENADRSMAPV